MAEYIARGDIDEVGVCGFDLFDFALDVLHVAQIFHRALFAGGDNQALLADAQRNLGFAGLKFSRWLRHLHRLFWRPARPESGSADRPWRC